MSTSATLSEPQSVKQPHKIVSQDEWISARKELLKKEKAALRQLDALAEERRELPWVKVSKDYVFDGPGGKVKLADLFAGNDQLVIYHFMFGPDWQEGCPSCSFVSDHFDGMLPHLAARHVTMAVVSQAPLAKIQEFKDRMGWQFKWVSSFGGDFNFDFHVSFTKEEMAQGKVNYNYTMKEFPSTEGPGLSVFYKDEAGDIYHTYSTYERGLDNLMGTYKLLDLVPKGRDEDDLSFTMAWVRHHDRYDTKILADADRPYWPSVEDDGAAAASPAGKCGCGTTEARA
ncbi:MAG TPA: thioredoxin family protein [Verrucomicrobium sp.]|nr:thioredoxin family protein [Verrucomicrobium sp.]